MDPEYAATYTELYRKHWWWRAREITLLSILDQLRPPSGWDDILDVGCGNGLFFDRLQEFGNVEGVEPDASLVQESCSHRDRIHTVPFDQHFLPQKPYSLILMLDVLEHLDDPITALRHARRLLAPDGLVLCTVPAFNTLWTNHDVINRHFTRYTMKSFRTLTMSADLEVVRESYLFQWVFAAKLAVRMFERFAKRTQSVPEIPHPWLNSMLYHLTRMECTILLPIRVPFGSSLLVVAKPARP